MRRSVKKATEPKGEIEESSSFTMPTNSGIPPPPLPASAANSDSDAAIFLQSLQDPDIVERVRATIPNAHVFKLPPRQSATIGWRGADWKEKVWQGSVKVVERGELTAVLLVDKTKGSIFAVCPVKEGAVDRCVDSSRYFVLRIENANGRHMFIGVAFNERNDAFDFNTSLEDSKREREQESNPAILDLGPPKDYSIKVGEKIKVSIPKQQTNKYGETLDKKDKGKEKKPVLKLSSKDTPQRTAGLAPPKQDSRSKTKEPVDSFFDASDPFPVNTFGEESIFFCWGNGRSIYGHKQSILRCATSFSEEIKQTV